MDVNMLTLLEGGRERTAAEQAALMQRVGLRWLECRPTLGPMRLFIGERPDTPMEVSQKEGRL
jgi:hypothetical protein